MAWRWLGVAVVVVSAMLWLSDPRRTRQYGYGMLVGIIVGVLVEYGLTPARLVWQDANLLIPIFGREAIWLLLFYGVQGLLFYQYLPRSLVVLQVPYVLFCALGTAGFEQLLAGFHLFGVGGWRAFFLSLLIHTMRLFALLGLFYALRIGKSSGKAPWEETAPWRLQWAQNIWVLTWPSMAVVAWTMMKITQRMAKSHSQQLR